MSNTVQRRKRTVHQSWSIILFLSWTGWENRMKSFWVKIRTRRYHKLLLWVKQTWRGEIYCKWNQSSIMRDKNWSYKRHASQPLLPKLNFSPGFLYLLLISSTGGMGMGFVFSSSCPVSFASSSSEGGLLMLFLCFSMESLPQDTVLYKRFLCGSFSTRCIPSGWTALVEVPSEVRHPARKLGTAWTLP